MNEDSNILSDLSEFKAILHPTRLTIMILLYRYHRIELSEIRKQLNIPWGTIESHFKVLVKHELVFLERAFVGGNPRLFAVLEPRGSVMYRRFVDTIDSTR